MPWWAITYLALFIALTIGGISDDMERPNKIVNIGGKIVAAIFVVLFMVGFFNESFGSSLGILIFPMLMAGIIHELLAAKRTMDEETHDHDFTRKELFVLNNVGLLLGNLFIVPGYVFGLMVGLRNVGL